MACEGHLVVGAEYYEAPRCRANRGRLVGDAGEEMSEVVTLDLHTAGIFSLFLEASSQISEQD